MSAQRSRWRRVSAVGQSGYATAGSAKAGIGMHLFVILVVAGMAALLASGLLRPADRGRAPARAAAIAADDAHARALAGTLVLIDIRTPEEWRTTGIPASAYAVSMDHNPQRFMRAVLPLVEGNKQRPVALICHSGSRSRLVQSDLVRAGFSAVLDVREGMIGGWNGPGWLRRGLPLRPGSQAGSAPAVKAFDARSQP